MNKNNYSFNTYVVLLFFGLSSNGLQHEALTKILVENQRRVEQQPATLLFYAEARSKDGGNYSRSTLLGFRNGIERFLNNPPFKKGIHIATDLAFQ